MKRNTPCNPVMSKTVFPSWEKCSIRNCIVSSSLPSMKLSWGSFGSKLKCSFFTWSSAEKKPKTITVTQGVSCKVFPAGIQVKLCISTLNVDISCCIVRNDGHVIQLLVSISGLSHTDSTLPTVFLVMSSSKKDICVDKRFGPHLPY